MKSIEEITRDDLEPIKLISFDVDGVLVPRGTMIRQIGNSTNLETKKIAEEQISQIENLREIGYSLNINSGRGLYMLQDMFGSVLDYVSLTYENGSATWIEGEIIQHINSYPYLKGLRKRLSQDGVISHDNFKGFEPKEMIITIHCKEEIPEIPSAVNEHNNRLFKNKGRKLYCIWNGEAYDIGVEEIQTKAIGLRSLLNHLRLKRENAMAIGDNYNDIELLREAGIAVTADRSRVEGDFYSDLSGNKRLPAATMMDCILNVQNYRYQIR